MNQIKYSLLSFLLLMVFFITLGVKIPYAAADCGDGVIDVGQGEECDDGNVRSFDGCTYDCQIEDGWTCEGEPSSCHQVHCNYDGVVDEEQGEECDDGGTLCCDGCEDCQVVEGWTCHNEPSTCYPSVWGEVPPEVPECPSSVYSVSSDVTLEEDCYLTEAVVIKASDVTFDCNGHHLWCGYDLWMPGVRGNAAITTQSSDDPDKIMYGVTIQNCQFDRCYYAVLTRNYTSGLTVDSNVSHRMGYMEVGDADDVLITNNDLLGDPSMEEWGLYRGIYACCDGLVTNNVVKNAWVAGLIARGPWMERNIILGSHGTDIAGMPFGGPYGDLNACETTFDWVDLSVFNAGGTEGCTFSNPCGDGVIDVDLGEECDDRNMLSDDGCSHELCLVEAGWECSGEPSVCEPIVDTDGDKIPDDVDNCPLVPNPDQLDFDTDGQGDLCDDDDDNDGVLDVNDVCPFEDASGQDADGDGCIDSAEDLVDLIEGLPPEDLAPQMANPLTQKIENAEDAAAAGDLCGAIKLLEAFIHQTEAQSGKKIEEDVAATLIEYAENLIEQYEAQLPPGQTC